MRGRLVIDLQCLIDLLHYICVQYWFDSELLSGTKPAAGIESFVLTNFLFCFPCHQFLDIDEDYFDWAAPSLTLPGSTVAPFSSKNTLYSIEAFWGLVLFPTGNSSQAPSIPQHLLRTLW